jgi:hypothetical protein
MTHFSMGITGSINRVSVGGRDGVFLQSNDTREKRIVTSFGSLDNIDVGRIFEGRSESQNLRVILSVKREASNLRIFDALAVISTQPLRDFASGQIINTPIRKPIRTFGDILSRNLVQVKPKTVDYLSLAQIVFNQISSVSESQRVPPIQTEREQLTSPVTPMTWRATLAKFSSTLDLPFSKNTQLHIEGIPMRFDAKIDNLMFYIISQNIDEQISWLVDKIAVVLSSDEQIEITFLITNPSQVSILETALSRAQLVTRIHIISEKKALETMLKEHRSRITVDHDLLIQVA